MALYIILESTLKGERIGEGGGGKGKKSDVWV